MSTSPTKWGKGPSRNGTSNTRKILISNSIADSDGDPKSVPKSESGQTERLMVICKVRKFDMRKIRKPIAPIGIDFTMSSPINLLICDVCSYAMSAHMQYLLICNAPTDSPLDLNIFIEMD